MTVIETMNYNFENPTKQGITEIYKQLLDASTKNGSFEQMAEYFQMFSPNSMTNQMVNNLCEQYGLNEKNEENSHRLAA